MRKQIGLMRIVFGAGLLSSSDMVMAMSSECAMDTEVNAGAIVAFLLPVLRLGPVHVLLNPKEYSVHFAVLLKALTVLQEMVHSSQLINHTAATRTARNTSLNVTDWGSCNSTTPDVLYTLLTESSGRSCMRICVQGASM